MVKTSNKHSKKDRSKKQDDPHPVEKSKEKEDTHNKYGGLPDRDLKKNLGCG